MNLLKKIILALAVTGIICVPGIAAKGDISVSDQVGEISDGNVTYTATVTNNSQQGKNPVMILVWYEDGIIQDMDVSYCALQAGESDTLSTDMTGVSVTDTTKVTGIVWEDKLCAVPVSVDEIERFGNGSTGINNIKIGDFDKSLINENEIQVLIPLYLSEGAAVENLVFDTIVVVENSKAVISVDGVTLNGEENEKKAEIDFSSAKKLTVTAEDGTEKDYDLSVVRYLYEDFETTSIFSDEILVGSGTDSGKWQSGTASLAKGEAAKYFITKIEGTADEYAESISIGVNAIENAHNAAGATIEKGVSGAFGSALRVSKTKSTKGDNNTSRTFFQLMGKGFKDAKKEVIVEYDFATDYTRVEEGNAGSNGGGIRYFGTENDAYAVYDASDVSMSNIANIKNFTMVNGGNKYKLDGSNNNPDCKTSEWHHVKTVIDMSDNTAITYIDGVQIGDKLDISGYWKSDLLLTFQTSRIRGLDIWVDNIFASYR